MPSAWPVSPRLALLVLFAVGCAAGPGDPCQPGSLLLECRQRCDRDSDCVAPATCDRLTRRCEPQPIRCTPASADGGATDAPDLGAGPCPAGQECDLLTRICVPVPGAACTRGEDCRPGEICQDGACSPDPRAKLCARDAECPFGQVCRLIVDPMGALRSVCGPPIGPAPPGARCLRNEECEGGLCLLSGVCFGGCTAGTVKEDCDGEPDIICGQALLEGPDGKAAALPTCNALPAACAADRDCAATGGACTILADPRDPRKLLTACLPPQGAAKAGGPCRADADCPSGLCLGTYCFAACKTAADCRAGFACRPYDYQIGDTLGSVPTCVPGRACTTRFSCPAADETCAPQASAAGAGLELLCTPGLGKQTGEACDKDGDCRSGRCLAPGVCAGGCSIDGDCPRAPDSQAELCRPLTLTVDGVEGSVRLCQARPQPCGRDADCGKAGEICRPFRSLDDATKLAPGCGPAPNPGKAAPGAACALSADCRGDYCMSTTAPPLCYGLCRSDGDCPAGRRCYDGYVPFLTSGTSGAIAATYDATAACAPDVGSRRACLGDGSAADCPAGEVCLPTPDAPQLAWLKRCQRPLGAGKGGATCAKNEDCQGGRCQLLSGVRRCIGLCAVGGAAVCAAGTSCKAGSLDVRAGHGAPLSYCQP